MNDYSSVRIHRSVYSSLLAAKTAYILSHPRRARRITVSDFIDVRKDPR